MKNIVALVFLLSSVAFAQNVTLDRARTDTIRPKNDAQTLFDRRTRIDSLNLGVAGLPVGSVRDSIRKAFDTTAVHRTAINRWAIDTTVVLRTAINRWAVDTTAAVRESITKIDTGLTGAGGIDQKTKIVGSSNSSVYVGGGTSQTANALNNTGFGVGALSAIVGGASGGHNNTAFGRSALNALLGSGAAVSPGTYNSVFGSGAMEFTIQGFDNSAFGYRALRNYNMADQGQNAVFGYLGATNLRAGFSNTVVGKEALGIADTASFHVAIGASSMAGFLRDVVAAQYNTAVGTSTLLQMRTGHGNSVFGGLAGYEARNWYDNAIFGSNAFSLDTASHKTTAIGSNVLPHYNSNSANALNTVVGYNTGRNLVTGLRNSIFGADLSGFAAAMTDNLVLGTGSATRIRIDERNNMYFGGSTTLPASGSHSIAIGEQSLASTLVGTNIGIGSFTLFTNKTGQNNFAGGQDAAQGNRSGSHKISIGNLSLLSDTGSSGVIALGKQTLADLNHNSATNNTVAIGNNTGRGVVTGTGNLFLGPEITGLASSLSNTMILATGAGKGIEIPSTNNSVKLNNSVSIRSGTGSPEAAVTGTVGDLYLRTDGGANTTLYVKESGSGNTGWIAK